MSQAKAAIDQNPKHRKRRPTFSKPNVFVMNLALFVLLLLSVSLTTMIDVSFALQQQQQTFLLSGHNMENVRIPESQPVDSIVYQLKAADRFNESRRFSYHMTGDTFSVDEQTGEVRLMKPLDRERQSQITVVVSVLDDTRSDLAPETKRRTIMVEDVDDSWPVFGAHKTSQPAPQGHYAYQVELSELIPVNSIVMGELLVTDADEGPNAELAFECRAKQSSNNACDLFNIESRRLATGRYSLTVRTKQLLDYERVQSYKLVLLARGKRPSPLRGVPLEAEAHIQVNVVNAQDEGPVFVNAPYSLSMPEGLKEGQRLLTLIVQDGDAAPQRDLSMIVVPGPFSEFFQVSKDSESSKIWYLETNATLDRESSLVSNYAPGNMFTISLLTAELNDKGAPVASEVELLNALREPSYSRGTLRKENVTVLLLDMPDSRPIFEHISTGVPLNGEQQVLMFNISESVATGATVANLDLAVRDLDQGINSRFKLALVDSDQEPAASQVFALQTEIVYGRAEVVLQVINSSLLDYENPALRSYRFTLVASKTLLELGQPDLVQMLEVRCKVQDANDNSPEFDRDQYIVDLPEGSPPGTLVASIQAHDKDSAQFGKLEYQLRGPNASKFKLISHLGQILVDDCGFSQCLDYEVNPSYSLIYEARDGGGRVRNVSLIINLLDVNDHAPKFTEPVYKRELISDNLSSKQNYISPQLIVKARDGDGPSQGRNNVTYRISRTNLTSLDVEPQSGLVYLAHPLDLDDLMRSASQGDRRLTFEAEVVAEDNGQPMLNSTAKIMLVVKSNRDGAPQFKQDNYYAIVRENQPPGKPFFQVRASDPDDKDSQLRYSLGFDLNDLVSIGASSGELSFKSKVDYDEFKGQPYNITVFATDQSNLRASATVSILIQDVNDKAPQFEEREYKATLVQGRSRVGELVIQLSAKDPDQNAKLNYSLIYDDFLVQDRNGQQFSLESLVNATSGYLAQLMKHDRLKLAEGLKKLVSVNKKTGAIMLRAEPDYSFAASVSFLVKVEDLNQEIFTPTSELQQDFARCTFFLQTHVDKNPIFAPPWTIDRRDYNISVLEELSLGTSIFSLLAKDPTTNSKIENYEKVYESDPNDMFHVDRSGIISLRKRLDYEELPGPKRLTVAVKAITSEDHSSIANVNIQVIDLNDNAPIFRQQNYTVSVSESILYPHEIITVSADDSDSSEFGQVFYSLSGPSSELFSIEPRKGVISLRKGVKLDRDGESASHLLLVSARDCNDTADRDRQTEMPQCRKSSIFVQINLLDENDNDPVFQNVNQRGEYEALVAETVSINSVISQVNAIDPDEGQNGQVSYEIVQGDDLVTRLLKIDRDGFISVAESLAGLGRSTPYRVTLRASDQGKQSRHTQTSLLLTVQDVVANDGVPRFIRPKPDEQVSLSESAGPGTFVYQVQALDADEETNGKIMYKFVEHSDVFEIDPFTGVIRTQLRTNFYLDREQTANYTLVVLAQDLGSPPKQAHQVLVVILADVNDNEPYFERAIDDPPLVLQVQEESPKDSLVGTIRATDRDVGQNALIGYEIIEGNQNNLFRLSYEPTSADNGTAMGAEQGNNACRIYSTGRLDREQKDSYLLTIKASSMSKRNPFVHHLRDPLGNRGNPFNQYNASDLTKLRVLIKLLDINDNRPMFSQQNAKTVVDSSAEVYSQLLVMKATDADSSSTEIQYSILDALYYSDFKFKSAGNSFGDSSLASYHSQQQQPASMRHVFDIDTRSGILRNAVSLHPYIDGYFEVFVKADSGLYNQPRDIDDSLLSLQQQIMSGKSPSKSSCLESNADSNAKQTITNNSLVQLDGQQQDSCFVAVTKAIVFITHQRETFRFVFNKTKLNDRLEEFKSRVQNALEELMFEPSVPQASTDQAAGSSYARNLELPQAEKVFLNTFNTDFYERDDGSLDFSTLTSCSQLVRFDDRPASSSDERAAPNQVISYDEALSLLKAINGSRSRQASPQHQQQQRPSASPLFAQFGLINIERCLPVDKTSHRMSPSERAVLYLAIAMALISMLLAFVVSRMRKSYEKNLKLLQRSKYQYMSSPYATLPPGMVQPRPAHHVSVGSLPGANFIGSPNYELNDQPSYDTWQL